MKVLAFPAENYAGKVDVSAEETRSAYEANKGKMPAVKGQPPPFEAVKGRIIEDVWLGITFARCGKRLATVDLGDVVTTRMYEGVGDLWEGFSKWTYSLTAFMSWLFVLVVVGAVALFIGPFVLMASHVSPWLPDYGWFAIILVQVALILVMRVLIDRRFSYPRRYFVSYPAGVFFLLLSGLWGSARYLTRRGVSWKDRTYTDSKVN